MNANLTIMKLLLPIAGVLLLLYSCSPSENTPPANKFEAKVDSIFSEFQKNNSPGCAVAVFLGDEIVFQKGYGMANIELSVPVTNATVFDIASVSKQFTAFAASRLIELGEIQLDDDIKKYFPELKDFPHSITVEQLIHHTNGLRDWPQTLAVAGWSMEDELTYEQILRMAFKQQALNYTPGDEYSYTNTGYVLLAELISRVAGEPFHEHIRKVVYEPLGMGNSYFNHDIHLLIPNRANSYYKDGAGSHINYANITTAMGSSSMLSTAQDIARWLMFLEKNRQSDPVVSRMHSRGVLNNGDTIHYAYGVWFEESGELPAVAHTGSWSGFKAITMRYPEQNLGLVILSNSGDFDRYEHAGKLAKVFMPESFVVPGKESVQIADMTSFRHLAGVYMSDPARIYEVTPDSSGLELTIDGAINYKLSPGNNGTLLAAGEPALDVRMVEQGLFANGKLLKPIDYPTLPLRQYAGRYYSEELQATYLIELIDGQLFANSLRHGPIALQPLAGHVFRGEGWFLGRVLFTSSASQIDGFQVFGGRVRRLDFRKIANL